jgi:Flp pilus assembly protein TadD
MQIAPAPVAPKAVETALPVEAVPPPADPPAVEPPVAAEPTAAADPAPATTTTAEPATAQAAPAPAPADDTATAPEADPKAAAKAKHASQLALERGKVADAIEAGEQSVSLDPSDAEAWLILGAAYQEKGDIKNARRSFRSCVDQGKRGPKWECAQMPH